MNCWNNCAFSAATTRDLAANARRPSNLWREAVTGISLALDRLLGSRLHHPSVRDLPRYPAAITPRQVECGSWLRSRAAHASPPVPDWPPTPGWYRSRGARTVA